MVWGSTPKRSMNSRDLDPVEHLTAITEVVTVMLLPLLEGRQSCLAEPTP